MATYLQSHDDVPAPASAPAMSRPTWRTAMLLLPYLWEFKGRVAVALVFLVAAKLANVSVPLILKQIVDSLDPTRAANLEVYILAL